MKLRCLLSAVLVWATCMASAGPFDLVTYNIRYASKGDRGTRSWDARKETTIKYLTESGAGIFGLQEVLHSQLQDVAKAIPGFKYVGVGRDNGLTKGEYSPIFYDPQRWVLDEKDHGTFWLSETPEVPGSKSWGNQITRICTWARLVGKDGQPLYVYNTHWDHQSQPAREQSARLILEMISRRAQKDEPFVLMGDLNATTDNKAVKTLLSSGILVHSGSGKQSLSTNRWKAGLVPGLRIDHIFVSKGIKVGSLKAESNGDPVGSDHHPVILRGLEL